MLLEIRVKVKQGEALYNDILICGCKHAFNLNGLVLSMKVLLQFNFDGLIFYEGSLFVHYLPPVKPGKAKWK